MGARAEFRTAGPPAWRRALVLPASVVTLGSGVLNLLAVMRPRFQPGEWWLGDIFPVEVFRLSHFLTLLIGFGLVITSVGLLRRKRRAWWTATALTILVIPTHLMKGLDWDAAASAVGLLALLLVARPAFAVRSGATDLWRALRGVAGAAALAVAYGTVGFWLLERHHFQQNFHLLSALNYALRYLTFVGAPELQAQTHHARWFLDSLYLTTVAGILYAGFSLYRPVVYRFLELPEERRRAAAIVEKYGRSALDFFKYWPDKSYFFSPGRTAFLAYRVGGRHAIVLGDPVGPEKEIEPLVRDFKKLCAENDWGLAVHQAPPDLLAVYARLGFRRLKIGDDAIVDLTGFTLEGRRAKGFRNTMQRFEKAGFRMRNITPPIPDPVLATLKEISDEWLQLPGRRERQFTLGLFDQGYVRSTPIVLAENAEGKAFAFLNRIPSYVPSEATIDLMRHRTEIPNGVMDFLFVKLFLDLKEQGFTRFNLGMAPMAGFQEREESSAEERAIHFFFQRLGFLFNYSGLRAYKAKFATSWEPRYLIHQHPLDLPAVALALGRISELRRPKGTDEVEPIPVE